MPKIFRGPKPPPLPVLPPLPPPPPPPPTIADPSAVESRQRNRRRAAAGASETFLTRGGVAPASTTGETLLRF